MPGEIGSAYVRIRPEMSGFKSQTESGVRSGFSGIGKIIAGAFAAVQVFDFAKGAVEGAASLQKSAEVISAEFGKAGDAVKKFSETGAAALGISSQSAQATSAQFGVMFHNMGIGQQQAATMTVGFEKLAGSLSAIRGTDPSDVMNKMALAAAGNTRGLKALGIVIDTHMIKNEALKLGLIATTKDAITPAIKAQSIYALATTNLGQFMDQAKAHADDFANVQRRLSAEWTNAKDQLGTALLPVLTRFADWVSANMPAIKSVFQTVFNGIASAAQWVGSTISNNWATIKGAFLTAWDVIRPVGQAIIDFFGTHLGSEVGKGIGAVALFGFAVEKGMAIAGRAVRAFNLLLDANPWVLLAAAAALAALEIYRHWSAVRDFFVNDVVNPITRAFTVAWAKIDDVVFSALDAIVKAALTAAHAILEPFSHLPSSLGEWARQGKVSIENQLASIRAAEFAHNLKDQLINAGVDATTSWKLATLATVRGATPALGAQALAAGRHITEQLKAGMSPAHINAATEMNLVQNTILGKQVELARAAGSTFKAIPVAADAATAPVQSIVMRHVNAAVGSVGDAAGQARINAAALGAAIVQGVTDNLGGLVNLGGVIAGYLRNAISWAGGHVGSTARQYANVTLGSQIGAGVVEGYLESSATLPTTMASSIQSAINRAQQVVASSQSSFSASFSQLSTDALSAFDAINGQLQTHAGKILATMQAQDVARQLAQSIADAKKQLNVAAAAAATGPTGAQQTLATFEDQLGTPADEATITDAHNRLADSLAKLASAQASYNAAVAAGVAGKTQTAKASLDVAQAAADAAQRAADKADLSRITGSTGLDPQAAATQLAKLKADVITQQKQLNDAVITARKQLEQAERTRQETLLAAKDAKERLNLNAEIALRRRHFATRLTELETALGKEGASHEVAQRRIIKLLDSFGVTYRATGHSLGVALATGLRESEAQVDTAAKHLAQKIASTLSETLQIDVKVTAGNQAAKQAKR